MIDDDHRNRFFALFVLVTICSVVFAYLLFLGGKQGLYFDAQGYYTLGQEIAKAGLFSFSDSTRTYGYPLFIAICWTFTNHVSSTVRFVIFNAQLGIFLAVCFFASRVVHSVFKSIEFSLATYASLVINPFLLIYTTEVLADFLSAVLAFLAVLLAVVPPRGCKGDKVAPGTVDRVKSNGIAWSAFFSFLSAGSAAIVRPASVSLIAALIIIWAIRLIVFREMTIRTLVLMVVGLSIPFVPQLINNYREYHQIQPLIVRDLYSEQLVWGMEYLKYNTFVSPGDSEVLAYLNPFFDLSIATPTEFLVKRPLGYLLSIGVHIFALFDYDFAFPYIVDLHPWYRWPLSLINYLLLFITTFGIFRYLRRLLAKRRFDRVTLLFGGAFVGGIVYVLVYVPSAVESRFSLPAYLLASPFLVYGLVKTKETLASRRWQSAGAFALFFGIFLAGCVFLSGWLQAQAPLLNESDKPSIHSQNISSIAKSIPEDARVIVQQELIPALDQRGFVSFVSDYEPYYEMGANPCWGFADYLFADPKGPWYSYRKEAWERVLTNGYFQEVFEQDGIVLAERAPLEHTLTTRFGGRIEFLGYTLGLTRTVQGGDTLHLIVGWQGNGTSLDPYDVQMHLVDSKGHVWSQGMREAGDEVCPPSEWSPSEPVGDRFTFRLPPTMPAGEYQITMQFQDKRSQQYLDAVDSTGNDIGDILLVTNVHVEKNKGSFTASQLQSQQQLEQPYFVDMQEMRLLGYVPPRQTISPGERFELGLYWRAREKPKGDYDVVVQLRDESDAVVFEQADRPAGGTYATTLWDAGEVLLDWHDIVIPAAGPIGRYRVVVMLRDLGSGHVLGQAQVSSLLVLN
jgi:hypothetical protein